jgi:hypothetical protein
MPSFVTTLAFPSKSATSYTSRSNTIKSHSCALKTIKEMPSSVEMTTSNEVQSLVQGLKDNITRQLAGGIVIPPGRSHVTFKIDQYTDIITHMQKNDKV